MRQPVPLEIMPGYGHTYVVLVAYWAEFPRNKRGLCAFCDGDPIGESSPPEARINRYFREAEAARKSMGLPPADYITCPVCSGRPS